uniref:GDT1 family protein n=1 Tax=Noctiluca scintillans TaxID=2966 RepID=A0A7S1A660_NOCSC|mmetsp:Transcript_33279/g.89088  ORF Transcript_33279/g.89088 Transcript_33279/m.89088 type:complete len:314 (+) Transcript_33279:60-1001(+)|eukprot:CAMPEP_0194528298 /NCGR_PEP_ID=MMETSP0253-20130528/64647_1 /TAXON_ID=2966 /ORGANISM="Noctiluca scintillans" /LENGTH=313 /DNA_ID=CAMNT_0039373337 /DNA_START=40 /DNA_END=981 /DNA_ORIENTATION=+
MLRVGAFILFSCVSAARFSFFNAAVFNVTQDWNVQAEVAKDNLGLSLSSRPNVRRISQWVEAEKSRTRPESLVGSAISQFVLGTAGALFVVLCVCSDDVVWLLPFLGGADRLAYVAFYIFTMVFMWALSYSIVVVVELYAVNHPTIDVVKYAIVASAILLSLLTLKLIHEWYFEDEEEEDPESTTTVETEIHARPAVLSDEKPTETMTEKEVEDSGAKGVKKPTFSNLFLVAFAGNFDNIAIYMTVLLNGTFTPMELLIGTTVAGCLVAALTLGLSSIQVIMHAISRVPLWVIIAALTFYVWSDVMMHASPVM